MFGRYGLIVEHTFEQSEEMKYEIEFDSEKSMWPEVEVFLYYVHFSGEIISDKVDVIFEDEYPNNVCI